MLAVLVLWRLTNNFINFIIRFLSLSEDHENDSSFLSFSQNFEPKIESFLAILAVFLIIAFYMMGISGTANRSSSPDHQASRRWKQSF